MANILIADDELSIRTILKRFLEKQQHQVIVAQNGIDALEYLKSTELDLAILDIRMPGMTGLDILNHQSSFFSHPSIVVMTAQDTMENAIEAMKRGAYDYITKPFDLEELKIILDKAFETSLLKREIKRLKQSHQSKETEKINIIGKSKAIHEIYKTIGRIADQDVTVLIQGESGTGKELIARAIHYQGKRMYYPFITVNCSAIPENLFESELFGHRRGAFTGAHTDRAGFFEQAHKGTIFLDEIGDIPLDVQVKLLRVLQEKEIQRLGDNRLIPVDVRIIAATNKELEQEVLQGHFREDLFFRLNVVPLSLPPLRKRQSDIPDLIDYFLQKFAVEFNQERKQFAPDAMKHLQEREWKGNIRELENVVKRLVVLTPGDVITRYDLEEMQAASLSLPINPHLKETEVEKFIEASLTSLLLSVGSDDASNIYDTYLPLLERPLIKVLLRKTRGNQVQTAKLLGINRNTLRKKINELGIQL